MTLESSDSGSRLLAETESILLKWEERIRAELPDKTKHPTYLLRDSLPQLLGFISIVLKAGSMDPIKEALSELGRTHGKERAKETQYSLENILLEYSLIRQVMLTHLQEQQPLTCNEQALLNYALDFSMRAAVSQFVEDKQETERQFELEQTRLGAALATEHLRLQAILEQMPAGVAIAERPSGKLLYHNQAAVQLLGHSIIESDTHQGYSRYGALHEDGSAFLPEEYPLAQAALFGETVKDREMLYRRGDGRVTCFSVNAAPIEVEGAEQDVAVSVFYDISALKEAQSALAQEKELARITLRSIGDGVITTDRSGQVDQMNSSAERLTGWSESAAKNRPIVEMIELVDERDGVAIEFQLRQCVEQNQLVELKSFAQLRDAEGRFKPVTLILAPIHDAQGEVVGTVTILHDASEERYLMQEVSRDAMHDPLTGLVNRREFERRLQRTVTDAQQGGQPAVLLFLDLDRFKVINDRCGHAVGDRFLRQITSLFQEYVRERDTLARMGGDEFAVILEHCLPSQALPIANALREAVKDFVFYSDKQAFSVGVSIGLVGIDHSAPSVKRVLKLADQACYAAKEAGRNRVCIASDVAPSLTLAHSETDWAGLLEDAIQNDNLLLFGQRIKSLSDVESGGDSLEILLRFNSPEGKIIRPAAFLPAAERYDLMPALDFWVVKRVLNWMNEFPTEMVGIGYCAINLSTPTLADETAHGRLLDLLRESETDTRRLCFEMAENAAISHPRQTIQLARALKDLGCQLTLEDIGTSMASFRQLRHLPVDFFKIDGSFIEGISENQEDLAIVKSINEVCHILGKQTIAKFVNEMSVLDKLKEIGVDFAQGYLIAPPMRLERVV